VWTRCVDYGLDDRGSTLGGGNEDNYFLCHRLQTGSEVHPASHPMGTDGALSPGIKRSGCKSDHSPPSSADIKNVRSYTATPHTSFSWGLIKRRIRHDGVLR
jgi:hypothetical protein